MQKYAGDAEGSAAFMGEIPVNTHLFNPDILRFVEVPAISVGYLHLKRVIDIIVSLLAIPVLFLPGLLIAAAIVCSSKGPAFYSEARVGRNGRAFRIWKFRTMHSDVFQLGRTDISVPVAEALPWRLRKHAHNPRITAIGRFLRVSSLDELPQFLNVLKGEMSLIGPRPIVKEELTLYGDQVDCYLCVKPGLSGLWQVSGRSNLNYEKRVALDAEYVRTCSLNTDLNLLFRTIPAVLRCEGSR